MSLQVWLPLNGNLNNQGLDGSLEFTNTASATVATDGKIGSCYSFSATSGTGLLLSKGKSASEFMNAYINHHSWSMCAWIKTTSDDNVVFGLTYGLRLWCGSTNYVHLYNNTRNVSASNNISTIDGKWHHICATYNTLDNAVNVYVDGIKGTTSYYPSGETYASSWSNSVAVGRDFNNSIASSHYYFQGSMNDVRIYDHCLSAKEVKEISKGLVCHYKLSDPYVESTTNYSSQSTGADGWNNSGSATRSNNDTSVNRVSSDCPVLSIKQTTTGNSAMTFGRVSTSTYTALKGATVTASVYAYISDVNYSSSTVYLRSTVTDGAICTFRYKGSTNPQSWPKNQWIRIEGTGSVPSNETSVYFCTYTNNLDEKRYFTCWQLELKDHSTPFVVGSRNESTVYDCSGLANNGTKIGGVTPSSNPLPIRYDKSYDFDGNTGSIQIPNLAKLAPSGELTMNCWIYHDNTWSPEGYETIFGGPGGFELDAKHSTTNSPVLYACDWGKGRATYELNKWNMITMTRSTSETRFYINGELKITGSAGTIPSGSYFVGAWKTSNEQNYKGKISDFRLYSTVLSVEDIKELYSTSASVDKNGNMYAYEFKEE